MRLTWSIQAVFIPFKLWFALFANVIMNQLKIPFVLLLALVMCTLAWGGRQGQDQGFEGRGLSRGQQGGPVGRGARGGQGGFDEAYGGSQGPGRQSNGRQGGSRYRTNLYSDDDVYGYDATYPNGEAAYINYKSKDARARRGPEFARTSRAYSRQGAGGERGSNSYGQMNEYRGGGGGGDGMW